ncbi:DNA-binding protein [Spongiactinospora rosea]|uniref:DNA-binding protein n=1 Tax=Spongiactinospora rosea TaxID=2248750 RepID=A0A366LS18_9ACTN|nr:DNA-binding protein [Spongiactinospora rosea]RBQ16721.1 DNA-binding protein [Spongiactinospora rosea]
MSSKPELSQAGHADRAQAGRERDATQRLLAMGADRLGPRPWRPAPAPPSALDLVQFAVWRNAELSAEDVLAALALMPAARAEVEGLESALLFTARAAGLTWAQIAQALGFNSPQACQQHYNRLTARQDTAP